MSNRHLYLTLLALVAFQAEVRPSTPTPRHTPQLVVNIAIDQLRTDCLEAFAPLFSDNGFKRLMSQGMVFVNASYPFTPVDRASAIASISTGTTPYYNSIVGNQWLNRETLRPTGCVDNPKYTGMLTAETAAPTSITSSTIGDELKIATGGRSLVYAIAPNREAAVLSAGHAADAALWIDNIYGEWCSSMYYMKSVPLWLQAHNRSKGPCRIIQDAVWEPLNDLTANYNFYLQEANETPFKHKFTGDTRFTEYKESGLVNATVTDMALQCINVTGMGSDKVADLLSLTYYAGKFGHRRATECQMELQDTYVRLDRELGRLMDSTYQAVGKNAVLFVVTSTGYDAVENIDYTSFNVPTGNFYMGRTAGLVNMYLAAIWGQGNYVEATFRNQLFLNHKLLETKKISISDATTRSQEVIALMSGVRHVYTSLQLLTSQSPLSEKARNGFNPQRCGDLLIEVAPGWNIHNEDSHQSEVSLASVTQFPIIICGEGITPERILTPVTTDRIAPTIAHSIRIRAPNACSTEPLF